MAYVVSSDDHHRRIATSWACLTITGLSCGLEANPDGSWDVETCDGWVTANDWRELCRLASKLRNAWLKRSEVT